MKEAPHQPIETPFRFASQTPKPTPAPAPAPEPQGAFVNGRTGQKESSK